jgi:hypothetical protein
MPSTRWISGGARALRSAAGRAHRRAEPLPRLPFAVAFAAALVALVAAVEFRPASEGRTVAAEELPSGSEEGAAAEYVEDEAELEIVEYAFSEVVVDDYEQLLVGVVVRNPYDLDLSAGALSITAETERGYPIRLDDFYIGTIPPLGSVSIGYAVPGGVDLPVEELRLEALELSYVYEPSGDAEGWFMPAAAPPEVAVAGTEPLLSPDGYRVHYRVNAPEEVDAAFSVLFRDGEGRLLGGLPAVEDPFAASEGYHTYRTVPQGESLHFFDLPREWMPEGADLDRIEISPST